MANNDDGLAPLRQTWQQRCRFREQTEAWYAARCAKRGAPDDAGELNLAKELVCEWLLRHGWPDGDAATLDVADLVADASLVGPPPELDAHRIVTALTEWIAWLCACGVFDAWTTTRLVYEVEQQRECFVDFVMPTEPASQTPEGKAMVAEFLVWLYEVKKRPEDILMADDAVIMAALDTLGRVDGEMRTLDVTQWLDWAAMLAFHEPLSLGLRSLMRDVIEWLGVRGRLTPFERAHLRRELDRVRRAVRVLEIVPASITPPIEA